MNKKKVLDSIVGLVALLAVTAYLIIGFVFSEWRLGWLVFLPHKTGNPCHKVLIRIQFRQVAPRFYVPCFCQSIFDIIKEVDTH